MFARRRPKNPDWDVWGNEIDSDIVIPGYPVPHYSHKVAAFDDRAARSNKPNTEEPPGKGA
jgi:hypothetical protein